MAGRRAFLAGAAMATLLPFEAAQATPEALAEAIREVAGGAAVREGKVKLDVPPLIENGNTVPLTVSVDHPMTEEDFVKAIHVSTRRTRSRMCSAPRSRRATDAPRLVRASSSPIRRRS